MNNITEITLESQNAIIRPYTNPEEDMNKIISELMDYIENNNLTTTGHLFARNHINKERNMIFEFGIPISENIKGNEKFQFIKIPKQKTLSLKHEGSYDNIEESINKLTKFLKENNLQIIDIPRYIYYNDPKNIPEEELITEIQFPIELLYK